MHPLISIINSKDYSEAEYKFLRESIEFLTSQIDLFKKAKYVQCFKRLLNEEYLSNSGFPIPLSTVRADYRRVTIDSLNINNIKTVISDVARNSWFNNTNILLGSVVFYKKNTAISIEDAYLLKPELVNLIAKECCLVYFEELVHYIQYVSKKQLVLKSKPRYREEIDVAIVLYQYLGDLIFDSIWIENYGRKEYLRKWVDGQID